MKTKTVDVEVLTTIRQTIQVPADYDKQDVFNFLATQQSFRDAFVGLSHDDGYPGFVIQDVEVIDEDID